MSGDDTRSAAVLGGRGASESFWRAEGAAYRARMAGPYQAHRLEVIRRLLPAGAIPGLTVDFGCGDGVLLLELAGRSAGALGLDVDAAMVETALARAAELGARVEARVGGVEALAAVASGSAGLVLAANVLAYLDDGEEERFYREAHRILRPGGSLVVTHSNELFDLFSLNAFTARFLAEHLVADLAADVGALLARPDEPKRAVFNVRENPLAYGVKLARLGFEQVQQEFANRHPAPPLLMAPASLADIDARAYESTLDWDEADRWKLLFVCSMFGVRAVRE